MTSSNFQIFEFKLEKMVDNPCVLIIGKRGCGKSVLADNIVQCLNKKNTSNISIISPSEKSDPFYQPKYPNATFESDLNDGFLEKILHDAAVEKANSKIVQMDPAVENTRKKNILVMDNYYVTKNEWSKSIAEILMNGRYYDFSYILTMQYSYAIPVSYRYNFDYIFLCRENATTSKIKLWENYAGVFPTFEIFDKVFDKCTENNRFMVIDNRTQSNNINDIVFWFKSEFETETVDDCSELSSNGSECSLSVERKTDTSEKILLSDVRYDFNSVVLTDELISNIPQIISSDHIEIYNDDDNTTIYSEKEPILLDKIGYYENKPSNITASAISSCSPILKKREPHISKIVDLSTTDCGSEIINTDYGTAVDSEKIYSETTTENYDDYEIDNDNYLEMNYNDNNYNFSLVTSDLNNIDGVKTFCDHVLSLKQIKIEQMKLSNEKIRLQLELCQCKKYNNTKSAQKNNRYRY